MRSLWTQYVVDVRAKVDSEIEPGGERRVVIILLTAVLCLFVIRFAGASDETRWLSSLMELIGFGTLADRLRFALEGSPSARMNHLVYWALWRIVGYVILPVLVIRGLLGERVSDFGLSLRGTWAYGRFYLLLLLGVAPVVVLTSFHPEFQAKYPFYALIEGKSLWPSFWIWELLYALQFVSLEFFFRGFLLHGLSRRFGYLSIFMMMVPYMMIHFQKPGLEAFGSIIAGFVLGTLALGSRSIWWGALAYVSVALSMDLLAVWHRGLP